jgi:hypothetical protein
MYATEIHSVKIQLRCKDGYYCILCTRMCVYTHVRALSHTHIPHLYIPLVQNLSKVAEGYSCKVKNRQKQYSMNILSGFQMV